MIRNLRLRLGTATLVLVLPIVLERPTFAAQASPTTSGQRMSAKDDDLVIKELSRVYSDLDRAIVHRDRAALEPLLAQPFTFVHAGGGVDSGTTFLNRVAAGTAMQRQQASDYAEFDIAWNIYDGRTAIRRSRVRFRYAGNASETWMLQSRIFVKTDRWRMANSHSTLIHEGPIVDAATYGNFAGAYFPESGAPLVLSWNGGGILATWPDIGTSTQIFPASQTEFKDGYRRLRFTVDREGRATAVTRMQGDKEVWHGIRKAGNK
jgi:hypothetical protein